MKFILLILIAAGLGAAVFFVMPPKWNFSSTNVQLAPVKVDDGPVSIKSIEIVSHDHKSATYKLTYSYDGSKGTDNVFVSAQQANGENLLGFFASRPGALQVGDGETQARLAVNASSSPPHFFADTIYVFFYGNDGATFQRAYFSYNRVWCQTSLPFWNFWSPCRL